MATELGSGYSHLLSPQCIPEIPRMHNSDCISFRRSSPWYTNCRGKERLPGYLNTAKANPQLLGGGPEATKLDLFGGSAMVSLKVSAVRFLDQVRPFGWNVAGGLEWYVIWTCYLNTLPQFILMSHLDISSCLTTSGPYHLHRLSDFQRSHFLIFFLFRFVWHLHLVVQVPMPFLCSWFVLGRLWGNHFGPFAFQKVFTFSTLIRLLGEFSRVQVAQGLGGAPRSEGERGSTPRWYFVLFCLFLFECSTNAFDKVCFSCLQEHLYTLCMFKDVTWISIFKYT